MDAQEWDARYAGVELMWGVEPNRFVAEQLADLAPGRALDLACGEGRNAIWLAGRGWEMTAVDFSSVAVERGRELAMSVGASVDWRVENVVTWAPDARAYDLVLIAYLQLPRDEREAVFAHAAAAVAPGGTFFYVAHDARNIADGHGGPQYPEVLCTATDVVAALDGFDVLTAGEALRPVALPDGRTVEAIDTLVRATRP
jgi:SAM-dependent methyltransferase